MPLAWGSAASASFEFARRPTVVDGPGDARRAVTSRFPACRCGGHGLCNNRALNHLDVVSCHGPDLLEGVRVIEVRSLVKRFGAFTALHGLTFDVPAGSVTGFLGLNGAGKTTTLRVLSCFLPPTGGSVSVCGFDTVRQSMDVRRLIGYLPESVPLHLELRVAEYLRFRARLKGVSAREVTAAVDEAATRCRIDDVLKRPIGTLSKGYRQRVGLADAIVHRPSVLILDEPTSGLDPTQRMQVRHLVKDVGEKRTVFVSTHIIPEVEATCEQVVIIHRGNVVARSSLKDLRRAREWRLRWRGAARPGSELSDGVQTLHIGSESDGSRLASEIVASGGELVEFGPQLDSLERTFARLTSGSEV